MTLKDLTPGMSAVIEKVGGEGALRQHFLDMGVIPGEEITLIKFAPMGDPMELMIHGYELTLRLEDAAQILHVVVAVTHHLAIAQTARVIDRCMILTVKQHHIVTAHHGADDSKVCHKSGRKGDTVFLAEKALQFIF